MARSIHVVFQLAMIGGRRNQELQRKFSNAGLRIASPREFNGPTGRARAQQEGLEVNLLMKDIASLTTMRELSLHVAGYRC